MPNERGKSIDKTYLSVDNAEQRGFIHRDYLAHALRWSHIVKFLQEKQRYHTADILDIGCGREAPLIKTLYSSRLLPHGYIGLDAGPIETLASLYEKPSVFFKPNTDFMQVAKGEWTPSLIIMLEVLEHNEKEAGIKLLEHVQDFMEKDTVFFMSTPCYDGVNKAANHVYEWGYRELKEQLLTMDFKITNHWGTFASLKDYVNTTEFTDYGLDKVFPLLRSYYDVNLLSVIFAPIIPQFSRNCLWELTL